MAEEYARTRQYAYQQNSNLVLEADRESRRRPDEATGEVESLANRIHYRMGDRSQKATPYDDIKHSKRSPLSVSSPQSRKKPKLNSEYMHKPLTTHRKGVPILSESLFLESATYQPTNPQSRDAYMNLMCIVTRHLGAQPYDVLSSTVEEVLAIVQNDNYRDNVKDLELQKLLKTLSEDERKQMFLQSKRVTDFSTEKSKKESQEQESMSSVMEQDLDKEMGVAVVFDENEEEEEDVEEEEDNTEITKETLQDESLTTEFMRSENVKNGEQIAEQENHSRYTLSAASIDAFFIQRKLSQYFKDPEMCVKLAEEIVEILKATGGEKDLSACENRLVLLLDYDKFDLIKLLLENRAKVYYCTKYKQAQSEMEKKSLEEEMEGPESVGNQGIEVLQELRSTVLADSWMQDRMDAMENTSRQQAKNLRQMMTHKDTATLELIQESAKASAKPLRYISFDALAFQEAGHLMSNKDCSLPEGTWRAQKKGYEEVHVPAIRSKISKEEQASRIQISALPQWAQAPFAKMDSFNRVQSKMYDAAFQTSNNLLLCAPTGAGKTNVAMLTILHEIMKHRDVETGDIDLSAFKIVYIAPMKALVHEVVLNLSARLETPYKIQVRELSGDQNLSREQLHQTQIIVTTPEKWDIITRKSGDERAYMQLVRLMIFDEIHLLHDSRGPVLEALVARVIRTIESTQQMVRLVGLSATLPNYEDVAAFLRVDPSKGLYYFDSSYRPVPLQQQYIGVTEKKAIKRFALMNQICYEKAFEQLELDNQILIFVHSRKETALTAQALRDFFVEKDTLTTLLKPNSASSEILMQESKQVQSNVELQDLLPYGLGIHHAGMRREHRNLVEELFADGHLKVLVSTSTLAWGVNLPAHTVIIKGTQVYHAERGDWVELGPLDMLQMLGRAGRIQYDTQGEGIILTQHSQLTYYLSLMNQQLPVESQLLSKLADHLNAEIVLGTVQNLTEAANWLGYTYLYVRMLRNPTLYGISREHVRKDPILMQYRLELAHSAATTLAKQNLIQYERRSGVLHSTALGRIASHYYIAAASMQTYNEHLKPQMSDIEILRLFSLSDEFKYVTIRAEEKLELVKLLERVPVPVKENLNVLVSAKSIHNGSAKVNVLLQAYISRLKLDGFALVADMAHIYQSAARIFRALFEICLFRKYAHVSERMLTFCKSIERRMWSSFSPLRQFVFGNASDLISESILKRLEKKDIAWDRYLDLEPLDLGQLISSPKHGKALYRCIHQFPKLDLSVHVQPITRTLLRVELVITPDFEFVQTVHGNSQAFWIFVEDVDGEKLLYSEWLILKRRYAQKESYITFTVPLTERMAPLYYIRVISDAWLKCETGVPIPFSKLILPQRNAPLTELLDLQPLSVYNVLEKLKNESVPTLSSNFWMFTHFNSIQTQVIPKILESDCNLLICGPPASGKRVLAELSILKTLQRLQHNALIVYLHPKQALCDQIAHEWTRKFGTSSHFHQTIHTLTNDSASDVRLLQTANILIGTTEQFEVLSRRWKQRPRIQAIDLLIMDELHFLGGGEFGPNMEIVLSRIRFIAAKNTDTNRKIRVIALSNSIANAQDVGEWMGASVFSFHLSLRPQPLEIRIQSFSIHDFSSRMLAMAKHIYTCIVSHGKANRALIFVPSMKQAQLSVIDLLTFAIADHDPLRFLKEKRLLMIDSEIINDAMLFQALQKGVGYCSMSMTLRQRTYIFDLFSNKALSVLFIPFHDCYNVPRLSIHAPLILIAGTQYYEGKEHRYVDYVLSDMFQMTKFAKSIEETAKCIVFCHSSKKSLYAQLLYEPLPVESQLQHFLTDVFNAEIVNRIIQSKQDAVDYLTWTFLYRRLMKNPNYYNLYECSHVHISEYMSDLVESTVTALEESQCVSVIEKEETDEIVALNLGMIAAYYNIRYTTIELIACSVTKETKWRGLLTVLCSASEFHALPCRIGEVEILQSLSKHLKYSVPGNDYASSHGKVCVLLQMHFSKRHLELNAFLAMDLKFILERAIRVIHAMIDVLSSNKWLKPALAAMDLAQMIVQAQYQSDSALYQIPFFTFKVMEKLRELDLPQVECPTDILSLDDEVRAQFLPSDPAELATIAAFCNDFPDVNMTITLERVNVCAGETVRVNVELEREVEDERGEGFVHARYYPMSKAENYYVVLGDEKSNELMSIKRVLFDRGMERKSVQLECTAPMETGQYSYQIYVVCDGYLGADLENEVAVHVVQEKTDEETVEE